ncbi:hypothetical protein PR048_032981 [Dryococelus australis]|uniref:Uncharacterized protein n=1 Tax=Dryococelus australis TaxID=614101 RepID=A0ABQ9G6W4_9NEOP|nr:hypothetical protein PR048_032981 [Dryococelus australis]
MSSRAYRLAFEGYTEERSRFAVVSYLGHVEYEVAPGQSLEAVEERQLSVDTTGIVECEVGLQQAVKAASHDGQLLPLRLVYLEHVALPCPSRRSSDLRPGTPGRRWSPISPPRAPQPSPTHQTLPPMRQCGATGVYSAAGCFTRTLPGLARISRTGVITTSATEWSAPQSIHTSLPFNAPSDTLAVCLAPGCPLQATRNTNLSDIWATLNSEVLRADEGVASSVGMKGRVKREVLKKTRRPTASSGTIPTCENPETRPGLNPDILGGRRALYPLCHRGPAVTCYVVVSEHEHCLRNVQCLPGDILQVLISTSRNNFLDVKMKLESCLLTRIVLSSLLSCHKLKVAAKSRSGESLLSALRVKARRQVELVFVETNDHIDDDDDNDDDGIMMFLKKLRAPSLAGTRGNVMAHLQPLHKLVCSDNTQGVSTWLKAIGSVVGDSTLMNWKSLPTFTVFEHVVEGDRKCSG